MSFSLKNPLLGLGAAALATVCVVGLTSAAEPSPPAKEDGASHFVEVAKVLQSPRCMNCHPVGDAPLHGDKPTPHSMNVTRRSVAAGLHCTTCHRNENQAEEHAPPGVPGWRMPSAEMPLVFEGLSVAELCSRLKDPKQNGGRTLQSLVEHMDHDELVLWGWKPGPGRTLPPLTHEATMGHLKRWVEAGAPCPK